MPLPATNPSASLSPLGELRAAPLRGLGFLARAWAAVFVVEASLNTIGYKKTLAWIEGAPQRRWWSVVRARGSSEGSSGVVARRSAVSPQLGERLVSTAYRAHVFAGGCLPRSLVQYLLHRRDGTPARFVIGVRRPAGRRGAGMEAHAWVEGEEAHVRQSLPDDVRRSFPQEIGFASIFRSGGSRWSPAGASAIGDRP